MKQESHSAIHELCLWLLLLFRSLYNEQCGADGLHPVENGWYLSVSQGDHTVLNSSCFITNVFHDYMDVYLQNFLERNFEFSSRENEN